MPCQDAATSTSPFRVARNHLNISWVWPFVFVCRSLCNHCQERAGMLPLWRHNCRQTNTMWRCISCLVMETLHTIHDFEVIMKQRRAWQLHVSRQQQQGAKTKNVLMSYLDTAWCARRLLTDMGTPAGSHSHCVMTPKAGTPTLSTLRCRNPDCPDLVTIDARHLHAASCYAANKYWIIVMLFWDYGNLKVMCMLQGGKKEQWTSCPVSSLFLPWIENNPSILQSWKAETHNRRTRMKY